MIPTPTIAERIASMQADGWSVQTLDGRVLSMEWRDPTRPNDSPLTPLKKQDNTTAG